LNKILGLSGSCDFTGAITCNDITSGGNITFGNYGLTAKLLFKNAGTNYNFIAVDAYNDFNINCNNVNILQLQMEQH
jgi:hypothetical protein